MQTNLGNRSKLYFLFADTTLDIGNMTKNLKKAKATKKTKITEGTCYSTVKVYYVYNNEKCMQI